VQDVEYGDAILARGDVGERVDTEVIGEPCQPWLEHVILPESSCPKSSCASGGLLDAEMGRDRGATAGAHPAVDFLGVVDDLGDRAVEAEEAVGQAEIVARLAQRAEAAHEVRAAAADDDEERRRAVAAEMLAQRVGHRAEGLED